MKIAAFGDLHGHIFKDFDTKTDKTGSQRLDNIISSIRYMGDYCLSMGIRHILFSGDLYNVRGKMSTVVHNAIYDEIKSLAEEGLIFVMIPGNHDQVDNSDVPQNSLHQYMEIENVYVHDQIEHDLNVYDENGVLVPILCVPFSKNVDKIKERLERYQPDDNNTILLMHAGISGAVVGQHSYPLMDAFTIEDLHPDKFKYIVLGHYHKPQFIGGLPHAFYCGSPIQHSFNDEGEDRGFYVVDTSKRWDIEFIPIPSPQFHTVDWKYMKDWDELCSYRDKGDYVRVIIPESGMDEFSACVPSGLQYKIVLDKEYTAETRVDLNVGMPFSEIVTKYAEEYNPEAKEIGLKILEEVEGNL